MVVISTSRRVILFNMTTSRYVMFNTSVVVQKAFVGASGVLLYALETACQSDVKPTFTVVAIGNN